MLAGYKFEDEALRLFSLTLAGSSHASQRPLPPG